MIAEAVLQCFGFVAKSQGRCYGADQLYLLLVYISTLRQKLDRTLTGMWVTVRGWVGVSQSVQVCAEMDVKGVHKRLRMRLKFHYRADL